MLKLSLREVRHLRWDIALYVLVLAALYSVVIALLSFSGAALDDIERTIAEYDESFDYSVTVSNPDRDTPALLEAQGLSRCACTFLAEDRLLRGTALARENCSRSANGVVTMGGACFPGQETAVEWISGASFDSNRENLAAIWLSDEIAAELEISVDEEEVLPGVQLTIANAAGAVECTVCGVYRATPDAPDYVLTQACGARILRQNGCTEKYYLTASASGYKVCRRALSALRGSGLSVTCNLYQYVNDAVSSIYTACAGFLAMCGVLFVAMLLIFASFLKVIFIRRASFIGLLRMLGMRTGGVLGVYALVFAYMLLLTSAVGIPCGKGLTAWICQSYAAMFHLPTVLDAFDLRIVAAASALLLLLLGVTLLLMHRKLRRISPRQVAREGGTA